MITIVVMIGIRLASTIDWIMSHLGKNPKKGGKPPKDKRVVNKENLIIGGL